MLTIDAAPATQYFATCGPKPGHAGIATHHLHFAWDNQTPVFHGLSLAPDSGEHVLLVRRVRPDELLTRFEEPRGDQILLGDVDRMALDEPTLRMHVACAFQFTWTREATLADNPRLKRPDANEADMHSVLALVGPDLAVLGWKDGIHTCVKKAGRASLAVSAVAWTLPAPCCATPRSPCSTRAWTWRRNASWCGA